MDSVAAFSLLPSEEYFPTPIPQALLICRSQFSLSVYLLRFSLTFLKILHSVETLAFVASHFRIISLSKMKSLDGSTGGWGSSTCRGEPLTALAAGQQAGIVHLSISHGYLMSCAPWQGGFPGRVLRWKDYSGTRMV